MHCFLVTGGAGFIGSHFVQQCLRESSLEIVNLDRFTYAADPRTIDEINAGDVHGNRHHFVHGDISDRGLVAQCLGRHRPDRIIHFAAETHVDRSIDGPSAFVQSNIVGTTTLLETTLQYWKTLDAAAQQNFRWIQISTDEVFGDAWADDPAGQTNTKPEGGTRRFHEGSPYAPSSPYAASKAAADHWVTSHSRTFGLPTTIIHGSNNFGPRQYPEKLIPLMIRRAISEQSLPIYGDGSQQRDWIAVQDFADAIWKICNATDPGPRYCVGTGTVQANRDVVTHLCDLLDEIQPRNGGSYRDQITFVRDRPGHDRRYCVDASRVRDEFSWRPTRTFETQLRETVAWYLSHRDWHAADHGRHDTRIQDTSDAT
ncbi:MAG: dTDP-glucose 4,6-dehydratase [Planctomycetota bacterium]